MNDFKETYLGKYKLGGGLGSWAKSFERGVKQGDMRCIGGIPMYASTIYRKGLFTYEINWCPVDRELCHSFEKLREWKEK